jgi:photosynthetic reaction center cytochrome c subunit
MLGGRFGQNEPSLKVGYSSLPVDPFSSYLLAGGDEIRVASKAALPDRSNPQGVKEAEHTYGLMMHFSGALGVNCTYCHNTRAMGEWANNPPTRNTAWYGIRMLRDLNTAYLDPLQPVYPAERLGEMGDAPKANCATCHQGAYKPLYGVSMLAEHPELAAPSGSSTKVASVAKVKAK